MGGHTSKTTATAVATIASSDIQTATVDDVSYTSGSNTFTLSGDGDVVDVVTQTVKVSIDTASAVTAAASSATQDQIASDLENTSSDHSVSFTQWLDDSGDTTASTVTETVTQLTDQQNLTSCFTNLDGSNIIAISGSGDVVKDFIQTSMASEVASCIMNSNETASAVAAATNAINQSATYASENPFAFVTDAIEAVARDALLFAVVAFILVVAFVLVSKELAERAARAGPPAPARAESRAAE